VNTLCKLVNRWRRAVGTTACLVNRNLGDAQSYHYLHSRSVGFKFSNITSF